MQNASERRKTCEENQTEAKFVSCQKYTAPIAFVTMQLLRVT